MSKKIAILATDGFKYSELTHPQEACKQARHEVTVVAPEPGTIAAAHDEGTVIVETTLTDTSPDQFDALLLPGGVANPDSLRANELAVRFVKHFVDEQKPIAAICHGPWTLIEAGGVAGKTVTSWPSLKTDLQNAGAKWVDEVFVKDNNLVTSRKPDDLPAFTDTFLQMLT